MKKILITGATGFIGNEILNKIDLDKYSAICLVRDENKITVRKKNIEYIKFDLDFPQEKYLDLPKTDYVIHLGARGSTAKPDLEKSKVTNIKATENILKYCKKNKVQKIVYMGTLSKNKGIYSSTKSEAEERIIKSGVKYTIIKPALIYSENSGGVFKAMEKFIEKMPIVPVIGSGKYVLQPLHVEDVVDLTFKALESEKANSKIYEVAALENTSFNDVLKSMEKGLGKKRIFIHIPFWMVYLPIKVFSSFIHLPINADNVLGLVTAKFIDSKEATKDLGFRPKPFSIKYPEMMKNKTKIAIVGLGKMGLLHTTIIRNIPNCSIVAVCDANKSAKLKMKLLNIKAKFYSDYTEMMKKEALDAVFLCTPPKISTKIGIFFAEHNVPVFAEKPVAVNHEDAVALVEATKKYKIQNAVGYMKLYNPLIQKFISLVHENAIGSIHSIDSEVFIEGTTQKPKNMNTWKFDKKISGGGVVSDLACHLLSVFTFLFGEALEVKSKLKSVHTNADDEASINLKFKENLKVNLEASSVKIGYKALHIKIAAKGTNGEITLEGDKIVLKTGGKEKSWTLEELRPEECVFFQGYDYYLQDKAFLDSLKTKAKLANSFENSLAIHKIIDKIYAQQK